MSSYGAYFLLEDIGGSEQRRTWKPSERTLRKEERGQKTGKRRQGNNMTSSNELDNPICFQFLG